MKGVYVCGRCLQSPDHPFLLGSTTMVGVCTRCGGHAVWLLDEKVHQPRVGRAGTTLAFSTAVTLIPYPPIVWDVNGYYRALGVTPAATTMQLRQAYTLLGGPDDQRLTYILKQLLDPVTRRRYDSCQPGEVFFDLFLRDIVKRRAEALTKQAIDQGRVKVDDLTPPQDFADRINNAISVLDTTEGDSETGRWGYFLWRSSCADEARLQKWRAALSNACASRNVIVNLGVGFCTTYRPWVLIQVGPTRVVFLHDEEQPNSAMAADVVDQITRRLPASDLPEEVLNA